MSKKVNVTKETATTTTVEVSLRNLFEKYPNASLRKLAQACDLSYGWVLKKSKSPVVGVAYDPEFVNYEAVQDMLLGKGIDYTAIDWEALNATASRQGSTLPKDMDAFEVGKEVYLREDNTTPYEICYKTATHIVILKKGTTEPKAWSHATFLMKGPVFTPRAEKKNAEVEVEEA